MLKIAQASAQSQAQPTCHSKADTDSVFHGGIDCNLPLPEFFAAALKENEAYCASRQGKERYTSPLFNLVRYLKSHPTLAACSAEEAFARLNTELKPEWGNLFPTVTVVSLEFVTAWEQANIPACSSALLLAGERAINQPLTLRKPHVCEGYDKYLAVALHLQKLTPRRDILLPVRLLSGLLSQMLGKSISEQSMSNYCRLAQNDGYITRTVKAHHPSGKAAQYRFDLKRFSDQGIELAPSSALPESHCIQDRHGTYGIQGIHGTHGFQGNQASSSSCVLKHAEDVGQKKTKNEYREKIEEEENNHKNHNTGEKILVTDVLHTSCGKYPGGNKIKKKPQSVVSVWQSAMHAISGWQPLLHDEDLMKLRKFGGRTGSLGAVILKWVLKNWETFGSTAAGPGKAFPLVPTIAFFYANEALAFNLWTKAEFDPNEVIELEAALENLAVDFDELECRYTLGEEALFENVKVRLEYDGILAKVPKGYTIAGITEACSVCKGSAKNCASCKSQGKVLKTFPYISVIHDLYYKDKEFSHTLRKAAGLGDAPSCPSDVETI